MINEIMNIIVIVECVSDAFESCNQENLRKEMDQLVLHDEETADRERELQEYEVVADTENRDVMKRYRRYAKVGGGIREAPRYNDWCTVGHLADLLIQSDLQW